MDIAAKIRESITEDDQRSFVKFCFLLNMSSGLIHQQLVKAIGGRAVAQKTVEGYITRLRQGDSELIDRRKGKKGLQDLKEERLPRIRTAMEDSRHWSTRSLSSLLEIPVSTVKNYLRYDLGMVKKLGKWVPHQLMPHQAEMRVIMCKRNLDRHSKVSSALRRTFTVDETWVSLYMAPDRNQQRSWLYPWEEIQTQPRENIHGDKRMLIVAMDWDGICFYELLPPKTTVTSEVYKSFLEKNIPEWLASKSFSVPFILHDNARPHKSALVRTFLEQNGIHQWDHPAYSPDISPLDFNCFAQLKRRLRGIRHDTWDDFKNALEIAISELNASSMLQGVQMLPERWRSVYDNKGQYI